MYNWKNILITSLKFIYSTGDQMVNFGLQFNGFAVVSFIGLMKPAYQDQIDSGLLKFIGTLKKMCRRRRKAMNI